MPRIALLFGAMVAVLGLAACGGGGGSAQPTSAPASGGSTAAPVASPARPALASPSASPAASASPSPSLAPGEQAYEVQPGDTLLSISEQFYGDATQWQTIYNANKDVIGPNPDQLKVGERLRIPPKPA
ncbi:MAG: LysM peptidoglycan-binding domain-containing protein [Chloroflexi bacterium]|nr:LysM peptidoglycan-binding domain-containing protein [Chloroflexota bacterium]